MDERDYKALNKQIQIEEEQKQEADRIEVREETTHHKSDVIKTYKAFLLPEKEDELSELLEIVDKKFYTIEEIEKAIRSLHYEDYHLDIIVAHVINNLKK